MKFSAHKIILSSCSKTFNFILQGNVHSNPLLYLSGVNSVSLGLILDYIYYGEVKLFQEQLENFIGSAQKLEIEGLLGNNRDQEHEAFKTENIDHINDIIVYQNESKVLTRMDENVPVKQNIYKRNVSSYNLDARIDVGSMSAEEIELKKTEFYQKVNGVWICLACGYKTALHSGHIRKHIETHMDGLCYTCTLCNKEFRSKDTLHKHKYFKHN